MNMNRIIKFRAWDKETKKMWLDWEIMWTGKMINDIFKHPDMEFMQFTGLKDKNGKEIYEGDIVKYYQDTDDCTAGFYNWEIKFIDGKWMLGDNYSTLFEECEAMEVTQIEVIGNIYENPDLVK